MKKEQFLRYWKSLRPTPIRVTPIPYKHSGSTYECDGIRITGSPEFVESVLSRLTDMLRFESNTTRLQVAYKETEDKQAKANGVSIKTGSINCYIQVHERGPQAQGVNILTNAYRR